MACAHAKFTGQVGVCIATSGPGAVHLMNGLYDAKCDNQPVVAIVGQQARVALGSDFQQELDMEQLFGDVAEYVKTVSTPMQAQLVVDRAVRIAEAQRGPTVVILPGDVQNLAFEEPTAEHFVSRTGTGHASTRIAPPADELARAAEVLNAGKQVAMIVGEGAMGATDEVLAIADRLGAGIITALLGKAVVPGDVTASHPTAGAARLQAQLRHDAGLRHAPDGRFELPVRRVPAADRPGPRRADRPQAAAPEPALPDGGQPVGRRQDDPGRPAPPPAPDRGSRLAGERSPTRCATGSPRSRSRQVKADPVNPRWVFHTLNERLPDNAIVTADAGTTADWYGHHIRLGRNHLGNLSGRLATMLAAMPYAIAAKFAFPERPVVCTIGDGAFQMLGMNGLLTIKRHWPEWEEPRLIVLVLHNNDLNQVSWEMREAGDPRYDTAQLLEDMDYAGYARLLGLTGIRVDDPDRVEEAWDQAFAADRPVVLDVLTDKNVPPLPAHVTFEQAKGVLSSLIHGDPDAGKVMENSVRAVASQMFALAGHGKDSDAGK